MSSITRPAIDNISWQISLHTLGFLKSFLAPRQEAMFDKVYPNITPKNIDNAFDLIERSLIKDLGTDGEILIKFSFKKGLEKALEIHEEMNKK